MRFTTHIESFCTAGCLVVITVFSSYKVNAEVISPGNHFLSQSKCATAGSGPDTAKIAAFNAQLSNPSILDYQVSYQYAADLIQDGLSNGTDPLYFLSTPRYVVTPNKAEDVVAAVQFASDNCLKVAALGTGHQLAGLALPESGMTINMKNLQDLNFDNITKVATVQMGAPSGLVDAALLPYGRLPIVGTCHHVGVAGFTLHGGNGWASMWHGAGADFVQSLDIVTVGADGKAVRKNITAQSDPDLFFGFRGAGGNLGVAIAYTTITFPVPPVVQISYYFLTVDQAPDVLTWWSSFFAEAPVTIAPSVEFRRAGNDSEHGPNIIIGSYNVGPITNATNLYFQELDDFLRPRSYNAPIGLFNAQQPYKDFATDEQFCGDLTAATYWNTYYTSNNSLRTGGLSLDLISTMVEEIIRANSSSATFNIYAAPTMPTGESAKYFSPNAWSYRDSYQIVVGDTWQRTSSIPPAEQDAEKIEWVREASLAIKPFIVGNYINQLMMEDSDDSIRSYEAGIFSRLTTVKAQADPLNLFRDLDYIHSN